MKKIFSSLVLSIIITNFIFILGCEGTAFDLTEEANIDEIIIAFGGYDGTSYSKTVQAYDKIGDKWNIKSQMLNIRDTKPIRINKNIYFIGDSIIDGSGSSVSYIETNKVEVYNVEKDEWETKKNMQCLSTADRCVANGKIFFIGGYTYNESTSTSTYYKTVTEYDPSSDMWFTKQDMPMFKSGYKLIEVNNKIYLIGGSQIDVNGNFISASSTVDIYNPIDNSWTQIAASNNPSGINQTSVVMNDTIFFLGGVILTSSATEMTYTGISIFEAYNTSISPASWAGKSALLRPRFQGYTCVINGLIYSFGGISSATVDLSNGSLKTLSLNNSLEVYNPSTNSWTSKADFPSNRGMAIGIEVEGLIYAIGGVDYTNPAYPVYESAMNVYEPSTNTWETKAGIKTRGVKIVALK